MKENTTNILVFSQRFPPAVGGTPTIMWNLLSGFRETKIQLISLAEKNETQKDLQDSRLDHKRLAHPNKIIRKIDKGFFLQIPRIVRAGSAFNKSRKPDAVFAPYPGGSFLIAAYHFCKKRDIAFYPYFIDIWTENLNRPTELWFAKRYEAKIFKYAKKVFLLTDALVEYYSEKYPDQTAKFIKIPHSIQDIETIPKSSSDWEHDGLHIVYTGQVYASTVDPIQLLHKSLEPLSDLNPLLTIACPEKQRTLESYGLWGGEKIRNASLTDPMEISRLQASADILFNPVAFAHADKAQVKTLFPTKTIEYLRTRKPILVCGPEETAFLKYAREKNFATLATKQDPQDLAAKIRQIYTGKESHEKVAAVEEELRQRRPGTVANLILDAIKSSSDTSKQRP